MKTKQLAIYAMLAAMCAALGYFSIDLASQKITLESFPVLLGGFLYGPVAGAIIGGIGCFITQLTKYGLEVTTPLWVIPYIVCGLLAGLGAKIIIRKGELKILPSIIVVIIAQVSLTILNTLGIYLDGLIDGLGGAGSITRTLATLPVRLLVCVGKSVAFGLVLPALIKALKKYK